MVEQLVFLHLVDMAMGDGVDALVRVACESMLHGQPTNVSPLTVVLRIPFHVTHTHTTHPRYDDGRVAGEVNLIAGMKCTADAMTTPCIMEA